jgi:hypothetical protein
MTTPLNNCIELTGPAVQEGTRHGAEWRLPVVWRRYPVPQIENEKSEVENTPWPACERSGQHVASLILNKSLEISSWPAWPAYFRVLGEGFRNSQASSG